MILHPSLLITSMTASHLAGITVLIWAKNPELSNQDVRNKIEQTADTI